MLLRTMFDKSPFDVAREMDRLFDSMIASQPFGLVPARAQWAFPPINLWEDEGNLHVEAELPGLAMEDVEVLVTDDQLTLKGARNVQVPEGANALRRERPVGAFERTLGLPLSIDTEHVEARLTDGVLSITMPKVAAVQPRRIDVKTTLPA